MDDRVGDDEIRLKREYLLHARLVSSPDVSSGGCRRREGDARGTTDDRATGSVYELDGGGTERNDALRLGLDRHCAPEQVDNVARVVGTRSRRLGGSLAVRCRFRVVVASSSEKDAPGEQQRKPPSPAPGTPYHEPVQSL